MKLASYRDGSRDGQLVVVSRDLASVHYASGIATRLQQVVDDWNFLSPQLEELAATLNDGKARHAFAFDAGRCLAPLPRAYRWARATLVGPGAELDLEHDAGDRLQSARDTVLAGSANGRGPTVAAGIAVITGDVARGTDADAALDAVRFVLLFSDARPARDPGGAALRSLASAFSPVAATPDELGDGWRGGRLTLPIEALRDGRPTAPAASPTAADHGPHFGELVARLAASGGLGAGAVVGGMAQVALDDLPDGCTVCFEAVAAGRPSAFGAIEQRIVTAR